MEQNIKNNGNEFVIGTKTVLTEDTIFFKDNGSHIAIGIENSSTKEANYYFVYKKNARELHEWLKNHL